MNFFPVQWQSQPCTTQRENVYDFKLLLPMFFKIRTPFFRLGFRKSKKFYVQIVDGSKLPRIGKARKFEGIRGSRNLGCCDGRKMAHSDLWVVN